MRRILPLIACALICVQATPNPYDIYGHARSVWAAQKYPQYVAYTVVVNVDDHGVTKTNHYHAVYDALHDAVHVNAVSDEEHSAPHVSTGVDLHLRPKRQFHTIVDKRVGNPESAVDFLGVPLLAPNYSFGMTSTYQTQPGPGGDPLVAQIRAQYNDPEPPAKQQEPNSGADLKEIAAVTAIGRDYTISLEGIDDVGGRPAYHLSLHPTHDPSRLRLREVWVDTQTYETARIVTAGNFNNAKTNVPWTIDYATVGGARYITSEIAGAPISVGPHTYEQASIGFAQVAPTQWSPLWLGAFSSPTGDSIQEPH